MKTCLVHAKNQRAATRIAKHQYGETVVFVKKLAGVTIKDQPVFKFNY